MPVIQRAIAFGLLSLAVSACRVGTTPVEQLPPIDDPGVLDLCPGNETNLQGDHTIRSAADLQAIANCQVIDDGTLIIEASDLTNLDGLENLREVDGYIYVLNNPLLENTDGLSGVTAVRGGVGIVDNPALTSANFGGVATLEQSISIVNNASLTTVNFGAVTEIEPGTGAVANLEILRNPALRNLDFESLEVIGTPDNPNRNDSLIIAGNDALEDLSGFEALRDVDSIVIGLEIDLDGNPVASGNASLESLNGLDSLVGIDPEGDDVFVMSNITLAFNPSLTSLAGMNSLENLVNLTLLGNESLTDLTGLEDLLSLTNLNAGLVFDNPNNNGVGDPVAELLKFGVVRETAVEEDFLPVGNGLVDLDGLDQVTTLVNATFAHNLSMVDFAGAEALTSITTLTLAGNTSLADFTGLDNVVSITTLNAGELRDSENNPVVFGNGLETMAGLTALTTLNSALFAGGELTDFSGLDALAALPSLTVYLDAGLTDLTGLAGIDVTDLNLGFQRQADGTLQPVGNEALASLAGLDDNAIGDLRIGGAPDFDDFTSNLASVNTLVLAGNESLASLAGSNITTIGTAFIGAFPDGQNEPVALPNAIEDLDAFANLGAAGSLFIIGEPLDAVPLPALGTVTNVLHLDGLSMTNLDGFDVLATVGDLVIRNNADLTALTGLETLVTITGNVLIENNAELADVSALDTALDVVNGDVFFVDNPSATEGDLATILDGITTFEGELVVCGNDGDAC